MTTFSLEDKWVLITGASSGFGEAAAIGLARKGARLLLGARRVDRLERVAEEGVRAGAASVAFHALDVSQTSNVNTFFEWGRQQLGSAPLHVLVNNAGGAHGVDTVVDGKDEDWDAMIQSNLLGVLRVTRAALPFMPRDAGGSIINIGSVAGRQAYPGGAAYCAAKAGELQITRALRHELMGSGIRVSTIDPGLAETEFSVVRFKGDRKKAGDVYAGMNPLHASDIADIITWVASRPPHVNIDEIVVKPTDQVEVGKVHRRGTR